MVDPLGKAEVGKDGSAARHRLGFRGPGDEERHGHVLESGELRKEVVELEDEADGPIAKRQPLGLVESEEVPPLEQDRTRVGYVECPQKVHESAFPDAGRSYDRHHLSPLDLDVQVPEHIDRSPVGPVALREAPAFEKRRHSNRSASVMMRREARNAG